jgi:hypothetical protein
VPDLRRSGAAFFLLFLERSKLLSLRIVFQQDKAWLSVRFSDWLAHIKKYTEHRNAVRIIWRDGPELLVMFVCKSFQRSLIDMPNPEGMDFRRNSRCGRRGQRLARGLRSKLVKSRNRRAVARILTGF